MNGFEVKKERLRLNLTQKELGALLEVSGTTVARWERDEVAPPGMLRWALTGLAQRLPAEAANTAEMRQRRRVKHRDERRHELRELAQKLGFESGSSSAG